MSNSLWLHGVQQIRLPCPSLSPRVSSNSSIESVMPSNHLILCHPLLLLPSIFPSIRVFSNESALRIRWPKIWSFSFTISPCNEYSGLISFRIYWLDFSAVHDPKVLKSYSLLSYHCDIMVENKVKVKSLSRVRLFASLWTVDHQAPLSMEFSRQEYWSGLPFPSPGDLPNLGIECGCPTLQGRCFTIWATREALLW